MTQQTVSSRFPYLPVQIHVGGIITYEGDALLDTGFTGDVILPTGYLPDDATLIDDNYLTLADGSSIRVPRYTAILTLGRLLPIRIEVSILGGEPIIGVQVIRHFSVILDHGRRVIVEP